MGYCNSKSERYAYDEAAVRGRYPGNHFLSFMPVPLPAGLNVANNAAFWPCVSKDMSYGQWITAEKGDGLGKAMATTMYLARISHFATSAMD